jgi:hypothetical protein
MLKKTEESLRNSSAMQMTKKAVSQLSPCHLLHGIDSEFVNCMYLKSLLGLRNRSLWIWLTRIPRTTICVHGLDV